MTNAGPKTMSRLRRLRSVLSLCLAIITISSPALGDGFTISPTSINVAPGNQVATLTVKSDEHGTSGQVRVMRWLRDGGAGTLQPTRDVVASPPAMQMAPGQELTIRLVRTTTTPVVGEECYRVLVDQLPGASQEGQAVMFTIRHSVPLCFGQAR